MTFNTNMVEWDASEYARRSSLQAAMAQEVLALLNLGGAERILDVGCGDGKITAEIARRAARGSVVGIDPSHKMISFAKAQFSGATLPNLHFQVADARHLPFQNEFDLAVSFNALHWIPEQEAALQSLGSALVAGAEAQLRLVPAGVRQSLEAVVEETRRASRWDTYFENFHDPYLRLTPEQYAELAERCGFRVLHVSTQDCAWDFGAREAFAGFAAVGCGAWTNRLPAEKRTAFIDDVLDRYQSNAAERAGEENTFRFYQLDIRLRAI